MLNIFQASSHEALFHALQHRFHQEALFDAQTLIVPNFAVAHDLRRRLCDAHGIIWQIEVRFWAMWEWSMIERGHQQSHNFEFAPLGSAAMRWKLFSYLQRNQELILKEALHPLHIWLHYLPQHQGSISKAHLWQFSVEMARVLGLYLNSRPDWLQLWAHSRPDLKSVIDATRLEALPDWLQQHYQALYLAQHHVFQTLFAQDFLQREQQRLDFYQRLPEIQAQQALLPERLWLYLWDDASPRQLEALQRLGEVIDVDLFHLAQSHHYIADLRDARWLEKRLLLHPESENQHYDSGQLLFSLFGKTQRAQAQLLAAFELEALQLEDEITAPHNLLQALKSDMQQLHDEALEALQTEAEDASLRVIGAQGLQQQLEHARAAIAHWLSEDASRQLSDVLLIFPEFSDNLATIRAIFPPSGVYDGYVLPARISGVLSHEAQHLWASVTGFYSLLDERFDLHSFGTWLLLPETHQAYQLSLEQAQRALALLEEAGFCRGFDEAHLAQSLHPDDDDLRFTFCAALDVLLADLLGENATLPFSDRVIIDVLCDLAHQWQTLRQRQQEALPVSVYVAEIQALLQERYAFAQNSEYHQPLHKSLRDLLFSLQQRHNLNEEEQKALPLRFVLDWVAQDLAQQQTGGEPSGVITISTIKAMRRIPYRFILFLQAEQERFPRIQDEDRYNLRELDRRRLGDRRRDEDDEAAFLDLFSAAQDRLWFYYNDIDPQDHEKRLPAQPVSVLLQHLRQHRPDLEALYFKRLSPLPFQMTEASPLALSVQDALKEALPRVAPHRFRPADLSLLQPQHWDLKTLQKQIISPVRAFLTAQNIAYPQQQKRLHHLERLQLNALGQYQLRQAFLDGADWERDLPAGGAGKAWAAHLKTREQARLSAFLRQHQREHLPALSHRLFEIAGGTLRALLPQEALQLSIHANKKGTAQRLLQFWLQHLAWCSVDGGEAYHAFMYETWHFQNVPKNEARQALRDFLQWAQLLQQELCLLPLECFWGEEALSGEDWLKQLAQDKPQTSIHDRDLWLYVLQGQQPLELLNATIKQQRPRFYPLFQQYSRVEKEAQDD